MEGLLFWEPGIPLPGVPRPAHSAHSLTCLSPLALRVQSSGFEFGEIRNEEGWMAQLRPRSQSAEGGPVLDLEEGACLVGVAPTFWPAHLQTALACSGRLLNLSEIFLTGLWTE